MKKYLISISYGHRTIGSRIVVSLKMTSDAPSSRWETFNIKSILFDNKNIKQNYQNYISLIEERLSETKDVITEKTDNFNRYFYDISHKDLVFKMADNIFDEIEQINAGNKKLINYYNFDVTTGPSRLMVFHQKHGDRYFLISVDDDINKSSFKILKENFESGLYSWMKNYNYSSHKKPEYSIEEINNLPDSMESVKKELLTKYKHWNKEQKECEVYRKCYEDIVLAIDKQDYAKSYDIINQLKDGEYNSFSFEDFG